MSKVSNFWYKKWGGGRFLVAKIVLEYPYLKNLSREANMLG